MRAQVLPMDSTGFFGWLNTWVGAVFNVGVIAVVLHGAIPFMVVVIPTIYFCLMIWEMRTTQHFVRNWRTKRIANKYARAQADAKKALAKLDAIELLRKAKHDARDLVEHAASEADKLAVKKIADVKSALPPV